mmetsp:Transcript_54890/g.95990  ORF Transcript_54890/g.95990 Transcript_54890/m.95990 type:complete len:233 (+) Transcript_54890:976-1674(+)
MHDTQTGCTDGVLIDHTLEQLAVAEDHFVLHVLLAKGVGRRLGLGVKVQGRQRRAAQVGQQARDHLLAGPHTTGLEDGRLRHDHRLHRRHNLCTRQARHGDVQQLLVLGLGEESVLAGELHRRSDVILDQTTQGSAAGGANVLVVCVADVVSFRAGQLALHKVAIHLVTIEIGVVSVAVGIVHAQGLLLHVAQHARLVCHDSRLVQCGLAVHQQHIAIDQVSVHLDTWRGEE